MRLEGTALTVVALVAGLAGVAPGARRRPLRHPLAGARRGASARPRHRLADGWPASWSGPRPWPCSSWSSRTDPLALALFGAWFVTLIVGLATDLDQRLLPNELTLPVIPVALLYALSGQNPLVGGGLGRWPSRRRSLIPAILYLPSIPFGAGAFGLGDVKLLVGIGLMVGGERALGGDARRAARGRRRAGAPARRRAASARRSYVPFGPFLILGALWAVLLR